MAEQFTIKATVEFPAEWNCAVDSACRVVELRVPSLDYDDSVCLVGSMPGKKMHQRARGILEKDFADCVEGTLLVHNGQLKRARKLGFAGISDALDWLEDNYNGDA